MDKFKDDKNMYLTIYNTLNSLYEFYGSEFSSKYEQMIMDILNDLLKEYQI